MAHSLQILKPVKTKKYHMKRNQIIASLGALVATGIAIYLIRRRNRSVNPEENHIEASPAYNKKLSRTYSKSKAMAYEPDDHPE
jgi:hypothetical protein